jgi:valyl-tRNA synthetase
MIRAFLLVARIPSISLMRDKSKTHSKGVQHAMPLAKRYSADSAEPALQERWQQAGTYHFLRESSQPIYSIDSPPATVSGNLHLGHTFSYSQADIFARFWRMNGYNVFYPMGFDDNGLATERFVEKRTGITAPEVGREAFIRQCLALSEEMEKDYRALWLRLGLSVDWRHTYRTIDDLSRRTSQLSFIDLYKKGRVYRREAPTIWCPECRTAIAQAELSDLERESEFITMAFRLENGDLLPIATTRPELLPACAAVFVHPGDPRYVPYIGQRVRVPLLGFDVPLLADAKADPEKGTGAVMCCTFGDVTDVEWWYTHHLPLKTIIGRDGRLTDAAGDYAGLSIPEARQRIIADLEASGALLDRQPLRQVVHVHERCDTPVEYITAQQWFVRVLDIKDELLAAGERIAWQPAYMQARYRAWVGNLGWDWCISRQRYFGVTFPLWYCAACGEILLADEDQLPIDPSEQQPNRACSCGNTTFTPDEDVMDTWATSSMSPQIAGRWLADTAAHTGARDHSHVGLLHHRQVVLSLWRAALAGHRHLRLGTGRRGRRQDQQEPRRRADGSHADDREIFSRRRALLGRQHHTGQGRHYQRREDRYGPEARDQAVERGKVQRAFPGRLPAATGATRLYADGSLAALAPAACHRAGNGTLPQLRLRLGQRRG